MKLMLKLLVCMGLIQSCGTSKMESNRKAPAVQDAHPDALSDEQIAELEKEAARLEKELTELSGQSESYGSATCHELTRLREEFPETETKDGKCSEQCVLIKEINAAIKAGDCAKAKELIQELKKVTKAEQADGAKKLKKCKEKIKKAKDCRGKKKDGDKGGSDQDKDETVDKDDQGKGDSTDPSNGKTDTKDPTQNPGKGKS